jgi:hypothetical protein
MKNATRGLISATLIFSASTLATYPGSVVSSFYAEPLEEESVQYFPFGITYGDGYMWVVYAHDVVTKRRPDNGSIIASFHLASWGWQLAWEENHKYIYNVGGFADVYWSDSTTGSTVGSFPNPPGITSLEGIEYDDSTPARPIWVCDQLSQTIWNLTNVGSVAASFVIRTTLMGLAFDADTPGGYYLFAGARSAPSRIYVINAVTLSVISSFVAPTADRGICDLSWDGRYLWALENGPPPAKPGWIYRFVAHSSPAVEPASFGKIKALYR